MKKKESSFEDKDLGPPAGELSEPSFDFDWPIRKLPVSGTYKLDATDAVFPIRDVPDRDDDLRPPFGIGFDPSSPRELFGSRVELRLDVDGYYPQMTASCTICHKTLVKDHWIAKLHSTGSLTWKGTIWYTDPTVIRIRRSEIVIRVYREFYRSPYKAVLIYEALDGQKYGMIFTHISTSFHDLNVEYDRVAGVNPVMSVNTHAHPAHPSDLVNETINIETVYRRAGFKVTRNTDEDIIPVSVAEDDANDVDPKWTRSECHDAMQTYWSRFEDKAQWAIWAFFATLFDGSAAGIMFDNIGPNHRQGTAIFHDAFVVNPNVLNNAEWIERLRFWCICHEMGHCFNLAHSFQKELTSPGAPWRTISNEYNSTSLMNYPQYYPNGPYGSGNSSTAYFQNFRYRFDDKELVYMRHAPERFVQPGNADWFDNHGFQLARLSPQPDLQLQIRANRLTPLFEFMEPVVLELKLTNVSAASVTVDASILEDTEGMTVIIKKDGRPARQWIPYTRAVYIAKPETIKSGASKYESLFAAAGHNGWDLSEPGYYTVQVCLRLGAEDIVSNPLRVRIAPPREHQEEWLAQDFFSDDVGRVLTFDGSHVMKAGIASLEEVAAKLQGRRVASHALVALGSVKARHHKTLSIEGGGPQMFSAFKAGGKIDVIPPQAEEARKELTSALLDDQENAAESLGHVDYKYYVDKFTDWLAEQGESKDATIIQDGLYKILESRKVLKKVLDEVKARKTGYTK